VDDNHNSYSQKLGYGDASSKGREVQGVYLKRRMIPEKPYGKVHTGTHRYATENLTRAKHHADAGIKLQNQTYSFVPMIKCYVQEGVETACLVISLTKDSSLLLHALHSPFYWRILKKTKLLKILTKNPRNKKLESILERHFAERKNEVRKQT
jgi:hypothetical protein